MKICWNILKGLINKFNKIIVSIIELGWGEWRAFRSGKNKEKIVFRVDIIRDVEKEYLNQLNIFLKMS